MTTETVNGQTVVVTEAHGARRVTKFETLEDASDQISVLHVQLLEFCEYARNCERRLDEISDILGPITQNAAIIDSGSLGSVKKAIRLAVDDESIVVDGMRDRLAALQRAQKYFRDPERGWVCNVLANGKPTPLGDIDPATVPTDFDVADMSDRLAEIGKIMSADEMTLADLERIYRLSTGKSAASMSDAAKRAGYEKKCVDELESTNDDAYRRLERIEAILEEGDRRLLAGDGPVGGIPPMLSEREFREMYLLAKMVPFEDVPERIDELDNDPIDAEFAVVDDEPERPANDLRDQCGERFVAALDSICLVQKSFDAMVHSAGAAIVASDILPPNPRLSEMVGAYCESNRYLSASQMETIDIEYRSVFIWFDEFERHPTVRYLERYFEACCRLRDTVRIQYQLAKEGVR